MVAQARVTFVQTVADLARFLKRDCLAERCADESEVAKQYFTEFCTNVQFHINCVVVFCECSQKCVTILQN